MSNVSSRERLVRIIEVTVPHPATRRDLLDLIRVADQKYCEVSGHPKEAEFYDDAYMIEARDDEVVAVIEVKTS